MIGRLREGRRLGQAAPSRMRFIIDGQPVIVNTEGVGAIVINRRVERARGLAGLFGAKDLVTDIESVPRTREGR